MEDYIEKLKGKRDKKNTEYVIADQKSRELSEAAMEIEDFSVRNRSRAEISRKRKIGIISNNIALCTDDFYSIATPYTRIITIIPQS